MQMLAHSQQSCEVASAMPERSASAAQRLESLIHCAKGLVEACGMRWRGAIGMEAHRKGEIALTNGSLACTRSESEAEPRIGRVVSQHARHELIQRHRQQVG